MNYKDKECTVSVFAENGTLIKEIKGKVKRFFHSEKDNQTEIEMEDREYTIVNSPTVIFEVDKTKTVTTDDKTISTRKQSEVNLMVLLDVLFIMLLLLFGIIVLLYLSIKHLTEKTERLFNLIQLQQKQIEYCQNDIETLQKQLKEMKK